MHHELYLFSRKQSHQHSKIKRIAETQKCVRFDTARNLTAQRLQEKQQQKIKNNVCLSKNRYASGKNIKHG